MKEPYVTIITTMYNAEKHLTCYFENLKQQTFPDYVVLIINDGSTDNTLAICQKYAEQDDRIQIKSITHAGVAEARNIAHDQINTPFVTTLDADDCFDKDYLRHLIEAQKKYDADLVISNVIYLGENKQELERFRFREEGLYTSADFHWLLAALLDEDRLNYLYGKLFKYELLKGIRVEPDVKQGEDTMINCRYVMNINSIAVIEDYDYYYFMSNSQSITSYSGDEVYTRLCRINSFIFDIMERNGYLDDEMVRVIDGRVLLGGRRSMWKIINSDEKPNRKKARITEIVNSREYTVSYYRQKERNNLNSFRLPVIAPGTELEFYKSKMKSIRSAKRNKMRAKIVKAVPDSTVDNLRTLRNKLRKK